MLFHVITYNIHKGIGGVDRRYRLERVVETLAHYRPAVVMLQEVDDGVPRSRRDRQIDLLSDALELPHRAFQPNVRLKQGHYGNAILSRFPLDDVRHLELTIPMKKRRRALLARCRIDLGEHTRSLWVCNFHLGLAGLERRMQLKRFLRSDVYVHRHRSTAMIAAGDFNDVYGQLCRGQLEPAGFHPAAGPLKTFPAWLPMRPLDRIYYRGDISLISCFAGKTQTAKTASDHLPLVAEFEM